MKPITLELMTQYKYLSNLFSQGDKLMFTVTVADMENNGYLQSLHMLDPKTKEDQIILDQQKGLSVYQVGEKLLIREKTDSELIETKFSWLGTDGTRTDAFTLPLAVNDIQDLNETYYLVKATIHKDCPDYYKSDEETKKAYHQSVKDNADYLILDEYPFFFNGAGFINGTRTALFLVNKQTLEVQRITEATMDAEATEIIGNKIYFTGNNYESMKTMFSSIYCYDVSTGEYQEIYHNEKVFLRRVLAVKDTLYVMATFDTCISGMSFCVIQDGELVPVCKTEWMFHNSIGSDCRYGRTHQMLKHNGDVYFLNTVEESSNVIKFDGKNLTWITEGEGSVDDMAFVGDQLYVTAMRNMKLEEIYKAPEFEQLTFLNEEVLKDRYVAQPERYTCFNVDEIAGFALKPINFDPEKKYPMILDIHGGPKTAYGPVFTHEMQMWASAGFFVIYCNPHCSDGKGDAFADYLKHYGATDYDDLMAFVDKALELYPQIDQERLGVTGGSYGGYMTNWIITHTDRFKGAVSQRSISNRVADFYYSDYSYDTTYENGIPLDQQAIELFWQRSPIKYAENAVTPTLFIQSTEDYRCPFPEAVQLFSALRWKGVETRICGFKGENHELSRSGKPLHRLRRLKEITDWLVRYTA